MKDERTRRGGEERMEVGRCARSRYLSVEAQAA